MQKVSIDGYLPGLYSSRVPSPPRRQTVFYRGGTEEIMRSARGARAPWCRRAPPGAGSRQRL